MNSFIQHYTGDGTTNSYTLAFPYITYRDLQVYVDGVPTGNWTLDETGSVLTVLPIPAATLLVTVQRWTDTDALVSFVPAEVLISANISASQLQTLHIAEEAKALADAALLFDPAINAYNAMNFKVMQVGTPTDPNDAAPLGYLATLVTQAEATGAFTPPSTASIDAATAAVLASLTAMQAASPGELSSAASARADVAAMAALLAELNSWNGNPPPDGPTIVARLDAYLGGTSWRTPETQALNNEIFTSAASWTNPNPTGISDGSLPQYALIETWGGGGAGGSYGCSTSVFYGPGTLWTGAMPGGGGGSYQRVFKYLSELPATVNVTVGAGGVPQYGYGPGMNGGNSLFGSYCTGYGGAGAPNPYSGGAGAGPLSAGAAQGFVTSNPTFSSWQIPGIPNAPVVSGQPLALNGTPGYYPAYTPYNYLGGQPLGGVWGGGGGGAGQTSVGIVTPPTFASAPPATISPAPYNAMDGASSYYGGGGGGGGFTYPCDAGNYLYYHYSVPGRSGFATSRFLVPTYYRGGYGGASAQGGAGGAGGAGPGQPGQNGAPRGGGGGGAGIAAGGSWSTTVNGPLGGYGGRGEVRVSVW